MLVNVEENLIDESKRNTITINNELESFLESNEGQSIRADIQLLNDMGFDKKIINKVYILLSPENIERAIDYMTEVDGIYQHNFLPSTNPKEKTLCFICKKQKQFHLDYIPDDLINEDQNNNLINNEQELIHVDNDNIKGDNDDEFAACQVCYDDIDSKDVKLNTIKCHHLFCSYCWFNYLKTLILEAKVDEIKCMDHECKEKMTDEFILKHISNDANLVEKYKRFKKRAEIIKDPNKKLCPNPNCESFLQKSELTKYVECENGHKYCFECLKPPHDKKSCDYDIENQFLKWKKGKRVKRCPRCQMFTEKNEGCNHMTCASCKYQWCWLCEGQYNYGHYDSGKCSGHQFTVADSLDEIKKRKKIRYDNSSFGIHKIFRCIYKPIRNPVDFEGILCLKYFCIFGFWIFSFVTVFVYTVIEHSSTYLNNDCADIFFIVLTFGFGLVLSVPYQIALTSILTPFILISFIYHKFFERLLMFFALGET